MGENIDKILFEEQLNRLRGDEAIRKKRTRAVRWVIDKCIRVGVRVRLCKDPDASRRKWENHCESFVSSVHLVIRHPRDVIIQCLIALGQLMSLMLVIIAIYNALWQEVKNAK